MSYTLYDPKSDPKFAKPYVDIDEQFEGSVCYRYVHGGFHGTETRFSLFFPKKGKYEGRFYQFMSPVQGSESASKKLNGLEDRIRFALTHGGYFVESNMGVAPSAPLMEPAIIYQASSAVAEFSRTKAAEIYGEHRPYGYIYGGSGGGFKTMSCIENTATWDGAVPFVIGSPLSIPNCFTVRAHAKRLLRGGVLEKVADAMEPGGSGNPYEGLTDEQKAALAEATRFGFPLRSWYQHETLDDGALPILAPLVYAMDNSYFDDFWKVKGYLGTDPEGSAVRDRIHYDATVIKLNLPGEGITTSTQNEHTGVDKAWYRFHTNIDTDKPWVQLESIPDGELYMEGLQLIIVSGEAAGCRLPVETILNDRVVIGEGFGIEEMLEKLKCLKSGDIARLDNSDYIAIQTYHRHQMPDESYEGWKQYRNKDGTAMYPQRPTQVGPAAAYSSCGSVQSGCINGKVIVVASLMDESAFPWQADWYRQKVEACLGDEAQDRFRLWYVDHALHSDAEQCAHPMQITGYLGVLYQALVDVAAWVEKEIEPARNTQYTVEGGQVFVPETARECGGIQPVIILKVNGGNMANVMMGETVTFDAIINLPDGSGNILAAEWFFDDKDTCAEPLLAKLDTNIGASAKLTATYTYSKPGTYFAVLRASAGRNGLDDKFTVMKNLARVRVVVSSE